MEKQTKIGVSRTIKNKAAEMAKDLGLKEYVFCDDALIAHMHKMRSEAIRRKKERGLQ